MQDILDVHGFFGWLFVGGVAVFFSCRVYGTSSDRMRSPWGSRQLVPRVDGVLRLESQPGDLGGSILVDHLFMILAIFR